MEDAKMQLAGEEFSLSDLANLDLGDVDEVRGSSFPRGVFNWEMQADPVPSLEVTEVPNNDEGALPNTTKKIPIVKFTFKCIDVLALPPTQLDGSPSPKPEEIIGRTFTETYFIRDLMKDLGRVKAFLIDVGVSGQGSLKDLMLASVGMRFTAAITQKFKKDDHDVIYTNLNRAKVKALAN